MEELRIRHIKPEFEALVRSGGYRGDILTLPAEIKNHYDIERGDTLVVEIKGVIKGKKENVWNGPIAYPGYDSFSCYVNESITCQEA